MFFLGPCQAHLPCKPLFPNLQQMFFTPNKHFVLQTAMKKRAAEHKTNTLSLTSIAALFAPWYKQKKPQFQQITLAVFLLLFCPSCAMINVWKKLALPHFLRIMQTWKTLLSASCYVIYLRYCLPVALMKSPNTIALTAWAKRQTIYTSNRPFFIL